MVNMEIVYNEKRLRIMIKKNLNKEFHASTKPSVDFIDKLLKDMYASGVPYDVTDMRQAVLAFAARSTNQADYAIKLVSKMPFASEEISIAPNNDDSDLAFYDVEVFPNLFVVCWKNRGPNKRVVKMINPTPAEITEVLKFRLIGFNNRRYDNHIMYARLMGYTNEELFRLSQRIIKNSKNALFGEAYGISYTDVYDFCATKQSLKKWEIELGINHQELNIPWNEPVPEELWDTVADYCANDVVATEAVFDEREADFTARKILADVAGMSVNDTTNSLSTRIIFGTNRKPQSRFNYRKLGEPCINLDEESKNFLKREKLFNELYFEPYIPKDEPSFSGSELPYFPGYKYEFGKSSYRGEDPKEGGYVYSEPGMYGDAAVLDITSMHPTSAILEVLFGPEYTARFKEIIDARIAIKHRDLKTAKRLLNGSLVKYLDDEEMLDALAYALKIAINSVYGLTSARFENAFKDPRNIDNIVAKRGALFMIDLKHAVQEKGFIVAHIKTDSIKIPDATPEIIQFVMGFGKKYGYNFEHEATYDKMCLVNEAVYIARYASAKKCEQLYGYIPKDNKKHSYEWTATGTQFQVSYVFKKLFSKESLEFKDMCETKAVSTSLYLDMNEGLMDVTNYEKELEKIKENDINGDHISFGKRADELEDLISKGHNYRFVGRVGSFTPIKEGCGGGVLLRSKTDKNNVISYGAATGTKGYKWLEASVVKSLKKEDDIDLSYYNSLTDKAVLAIGEHCDFEWFASDDPYIGPPLENGVPVYPDGPEDDDPLGLRPPWEEAS